MTELKLVKTARFIVLGSPSDNNESQNKRTSVADSQSKNGSRNETAKQLNTKKAKAKAKPETAPSAREWTDELEQDLSRILSVGEECVTAAELKALLLAKGRDSGSSFILYDGFEPSGRMHIAQGVFKSMNVNKCTTSGGTFVFWVADWFALMNDKMGGDLEKIKVVGHYLQEVWKAAGMDLERVEFKWASDEITNKADTYWPQMLDIARRFNITRIKKCCQIMGRMEGSLTSAQVLYPLMQCADVFFLRADICQLGVDQRKVNMLAREYCDAAGRKRKPVILSHHMLYGLKKGQEKMSKSDPDSAVFMEDPAADVERKIMNAYCPTTETEDAVLNETGDAGKESMHLTDDALKNPCLDYIENIIFAAPNAVFTVNDGRTYKDFSAVKSDFLCGSISEEALKKGLIDSLNCLLEPVRDHFTNDENAKTLLEKVRQYKRDSKATKVTPKVRRLDLPGAGKIPKNTHMVFAPLPSSSPTLQDAVDVLARLASGGPEKKKVLYLSDWTARVCNACNADEKAILAFYNILICSLKALNPALMETTSILFQSDAILTDPSNYWISVINVGRHFMLDHVMGEHTKDADCVGVVIGRLMLVADVAGVDPSSLTLATGADVESSMVTEFYQRKLQGMALPGIEQKSGTNIILQRREESAHKTENDEYTLLDDPKVHGKSKLKKAFCEPGNIEFCPPISIATTFGLELPAVNADNVFRVERADSNGGNVDYKRREEIETDFQAERLHPGDLKAASTKLIVAVLEKVNAAVKGDKVASAAVKTLNAYKKKVSKKKK